MAEAQDQSSQAYVRAALALQGYTFDEAEIAEITAQFLRLEVIARTVFDWPLSSVAPTAPVFRP